MYPSSLPDGIDESFDAELRHWRRVLHRIPETYWTEFNTTAMLYSIITREIGVNRSDIIVGNDLYNIDPDAIKLRSPTNEDALNKAFDESKAENFGLKEFDDNDLNLLSQMRGGKTGLFVHLKCDQSLKETIVFRFDIDALPIHESSASTHIPAEKGFLSSRCGYSHACGHDGHQAIGLGLIRQLLRISRHNRDYIVLFQPGEEGGNGGEVFARILQSYRNKITAFCALHLGLLSRTAVLCSVEFISLIQAQFTFKGRSAHAGGNPQDGRSAVVGVASAIMALHSMPRDSRGETRINVGKLHSSNACNVVADEACFDLDIRGSSTIVLEDLWLRAQRVVEGVSVAFGLEVDIVKNNETISWKPDDKAVQCFKKSALKVGVPEDILIDNVLLPVCEDAPKIMRTVSLDCGGVCTFVGFACDTVGGHHHPEFDFDEKLLPWAVAVLNDLAVEGDFK